MKPEDIFAWIGIIIVIGAGIALFLKIIGVI